VFWARFTAAGIPADEAVARLPRANLITTGAVFLVPALLTALAAVIVVVLLYYAFIFSRVANRAAAAVRQAAEADREVKEAAAKEATARAGAKLAEQQVDAAATASNLAAEIVIARHSFFSLPLLSIGVVLVAGLLAIAASFVALGATQKFTWFALVAFVSMGMFVAVVTFERTKARTKLSPVVLVHDGNVPVYGFYVTETADHVFIVQPQRNLTAAKLQLTDAGNRLLEFKRDKVTNLEIGPLLSDLAAYRRSLQLAADLCGAPPSAAATKRAPARPAATKTRTARNASPPKQLTAAPTSVCALSYQRAIANEAKAVSALPSGSS
jgi:hypothetical protein